MVEIVLAFYAMQNECLTSRAGMWMNVGHFQIGYRCDMNEVKLIYPTRLETRVDCVHLLQNG